MTTKIHKSLLGITGEYSVAAELGKRSVYAQLTLGNQKKADLLVFSEDYEKIIKVEVKSKQGDAWPSCRGICDINSLIIFVDFKNTAETIPPNFYILDNVDWSKIVKTKQFAYINKYPTKKTEITNNVLRLLDERKKSGGYVEGCTIRVSDIEMYKNAWEKIIQKLNNGSF